MKKNDFLNIIVCLGTISAVFSVIAIIYGYYYLLKNVSGLEIIDLIIITLVLMLAIFLIICMNYLLFTLKFHEDYINENKEIVKKHEKSIEEIKVVLRNHKNSINTIEDILNKDNEKLNSNQDKEN